MNRSDSAGGRSILSETRDAIADYRRLLNALGSRARRMGSRDPESAAQETLKRSLEHPLSQPAIEYYFSEELPAEAAPPAWPLDQLMAWLHGVLHFVVLEEHNRVSNRREFTAGSPRRRFRRSPGSCRSGAGPARRAHPKGAAADRGGVHAGARCRLPARPENARRRTEIWRYRAAPGRE